MSQLQENNAAPQAIAQDDLTDEQFSFLENIGCLRCETTDGPQFLCSDESMRTLLAAHPVQPTENFSKKHTDISVRLRETADKQPGWKKLLCEAADEIERYYGGMLAWKQTAETKDMQFRNEVSERVNERIADGQAQPEPAANDIKNAQITAYKQAIKGIGKLPARFAEFREQNVSAANVILQNDLVDELILLKQSLAAINKGEDV
jgi:hypothetical protein